MSPVQLEAVIKQLKAQTELLALIALKRGVDIDKINSIYAGSKGDV